MLSLNKFFDDPAVTAFISDGEIDFSLNPGQPPFSNRQRDWIAKEIGDFADRLVWLRQVHGKEILVLEDNQPSSSFEIPQADGAVTSHRGLPLSIRTADCLPVFILAAKSKSIGLIHAGWRGTKAEIVPHAVRIMLHRWQSEPGELQIVFGPAIQSCCYEVGAEFKEIFPLEISLRQNALFLDLSLINRNQLTAMGVPDENIKDCGICTSCDHRFFSYRRDKEKSGRMLSVLMLKP